MREGARERVCILQFEFGDSHVKRPSPGMQIFEIFGLLFG